MNYEGYELNVIGEIEKEKLSPCFGAEFAQVESIDGKDQVVMLYKLSEINYCDSISKKVWHYLSYANIWMGSSDDITKKRLLKII